MSIGSNIKRLRNQQVACSSHVSSSKKATVSRRFDWILWLCFCLFLIFDYFLTTLLFTHIKNSPQPTGNTGRLGALLCLYYLPASTVCRRLARSDR